MRSPAHLGARNNQRREKEDRWRQKSFLGRDEKKVDATHQEKRRAWFLLVLFLLAGLTVGAKFFYLQIIDGPELAAVAEEQYFQNYKQVGSRGKIYTADEYLLVGNKEVYRFYLDNNVYQSLVNAGQEKMPTYEEIAEAVAPILLADEPRPATITAQLNEEKIGATADFNKNPLLSSNENKKTENSKKDETLNQLLADYNPNYPEKTWTQSLEELKNNLAQKMLSKNENQKDKKGNITLDGRVSAEAKEKLLAMNDKYFAFEGYEVRNYPEASMAAQIVGFVGKNESGVDTGYFGIEGALNMELQGRTAEKTVAVDARMNPLSYQSDIVAAAGNGRDVYLTIRRDLQNYVEEKLSASLEKYGAESGEIIVMEPDTGAIIAWATLPSYEPEIYNSYDASLFSNPSLTDQFEPGSIFKIITVAAGLDTGMISPHTTCTKCSGPRVIYDRTIRTWDDNYHPEITMTEALEKSDNTAMIFITDLLGEDRFINYLKKFKISEAIGFEMQEDSVTVWPTSWYPVELATRSFGQGIVTNSMQMMRAVGTIANDGKMMKPQIISKVEDSTTGEEFLTEPVEIGQPITEETAKMMKTMLEASAQHGEAQWILKSNEQIAGKTGTSQIPGDGGYLDEYGTIASFIGFAPSQYPKFVMLVKLRKPQTSIYSAETSAVVWKEIAERLLEIL